MSSLTLRRLSGLAFVTAFAPASFADVVVDDFTTGLYRSPAVKSGAQHSQQVGARIIGGSRSVTLTMCDPVDCKVANPYNQGISYAILKSRTPTLPAAFLQNSPVYTYSRIDLEYGNPPASLDLDFSALDRLRVDFTGLTETLNFNVQVFDNSGFRYLQGGCNASAYNSWFALELPFDGMQAPGGAIDRRHITSIRLIFQPSSFIGGVEFGMAGISATSTAQPGATICEY
jgi:hypothetical protein